VHDRRNVGVFHIEEDVSWQDVLEAMRDHISENDVRELPRLSVAQGGVQNQTSSLASHGVGVHNIIMDGELRSHY
jgi:hypothetical protein